MKTVEEFGSELLKTGDLDPVYLSIHRVFPSWEPSMARMLLAYWCFYHLGAAAFMAEHSNNDTQFWNWMKLAAANTTSPPKHPDMRWPRASERRHFRGAQAINAVNELANWQRHAGRATSSTQELAGWLVGTGTCKQTFKDVQSRALALRGFGPWIAFKIADMAERVAGIPVDFSDCAFGVYKDPRQGAALALHGDWQAPITNDQIADVMSEYVWKFRKLKAPPRYDRAVNVQEVETVFCKYKSYTKGHYHVGKDVLENVHGLKGWGKLAEELRAPLLEIANKHWRGSV